MKKIICLFIIVCMCATLCACALSSPDDEVIGYVIIPHADGDEHADITNYYFYRGGGILKAYCADGRTIISNRITVILE